MIGLVLQGGGAKGGYHIGVWKALRELGIEIGAVTGTSVGALNGAFIAQNKYDRAYEIWHNMDPRLVISDEPELYHELVTKNYSLKNSSQYYDFMKKIIIQKGLDVSPLKELIANEVDEGLLRSSDVDFGLVTVDLTNWKAVEVFIDDIEEGKIGDYMLASAFLPGFKPQMIDGKRFLDGGFYDNLPINLISRRGYTEIVAVELGAMGRVQNVKDKKLNIRRIVPSGDTGSLLEFDMVRSRDNLKMGYYDTMRSYGRLQGSFYYLTDIPDEIHFYNQLLNMTDDQIMSMARIIGHETGYPIRLMNEVVIPELCSLLGFDIEMTYGEILVGAIEYLAVELKIERLKVYTYREFLQLVVAGSKEAQLGHNISYDIVPSMIRRRSLVQRTFKSELLMLWLDIISEAVKS